MNVDTDDLIDKTISFYIADTSGSQGEVSDSLKKDLYDNLDKEHHITFELSASINGNPAKVELLKNDTIHYAVKVNGVPDDSLVVNLIVKWTGEGKQETILEMPKTYSLSELKEGKYAIQLPVAFSDLKFYDRLKKNTTYQEEGTFNRISAIKDKSEMLYNKMMEEYLKKKPKPVVDDETEISKKIENKKGSEDDARKAINQNKFENAENYTWKKGTNHKEWAKLWLNCNQKDKYKIFENWEQLKSYLKSKGLIKEQK